MKLTTFDGLIWWPQFYDLDTTIGLDNTGFLKFSSDIEVGDEGVFNTTGSILWQKIRLLFEAELREQYSLMRQSRFTVENLMKYLYEEQIAQIPARYYNLDMQTKYLNYQSSYLYALHGSSENHIRKWIRDRLIYVDTLIGYNVSTSDYITLRSSKLGHVYLDIQTYIPMYLRVKWRDEANNTGVQVKRVAKGETVRFEYNMPTATDQEIIVYGGHYLKSIGDVSNLEPTTMLIANATRLTEITCHSKNLINTDLNQCTKLQYIDLSNCPALGTGIGAQPILNIQSCNYLKYVDVRNTAITAVYTMAAGGNLEEMYLSEAVQSIIVSNQTYLRLLGIPYDLENNVSLATNLTTVEITNCNAIEHLRYPYEAKGINEFESFKYVQNLTIKNSVQNLTAMSFAGFNRLMNVDLASLPQLTSLGFEDMLHRNEMGTLSKVTIGDCPKIKSISFDVSTSAYKVEFAKDAVLDISGLQNITRLSCNYSIKGLKTIIVPTSLRRLEFTPAYGDGINEIQNIWSGTANHATDKFTGIDFQDMTIEYIDMAGLSQVTNAINFNIAPTEQNPNLNINRDGSATKPYFRPTGSINLDNYTGSIPGLLKGLDFNKVEVDLAVDDTTTADISSLFEGCIGIEDNKAKILAILKRFKRAYVLTALFKNSDITDLSEITFNEGMLNLTQAFANTNVTSDIEFPLNTYICTQAFYNCTKIPVITDNWTNKNYLFGITPNYCYQGCSGADLDEVPTIWGGSGFSVETTTIFTIDTSLINDDIIYIFQAGNKSYSYVGTNMTTDWGDGTVDQLDSHKYAKDGVYTIKTHRIFGRGDYTVTANIKSCITKITQIATMNWYILGANAVGAFSGLTNLQAVDIRYMPILRYNSNTAHTGIFRFTGATKLKSFTCQEWYPKYESNMNIRFSYMFEGCSSLTTINFNNLDFAKIISTDNMFRKCSSLSNIDFMNQWDFSNVTAMDVMFDSCTGLQNITIANTFPKCTNIAAMFRYCTGLLALDMSECSFPTLLNMSNFLYHNLENQMNLVSLKLPTNLNTVTNMYRAFLNNNRLMEINSFSLRDIENFDQTFRVCKSLTEIDATSWNLSKVTNFSNAFRDCRALANILGTSFNLSSTTTCSCAFQDCQALVSLPLIADLSSCLNIDFMFYACLKLTSLSDTSINLSSCTSANGTFSSCKSLVRIPKLNFGTPLTSIRSIFSDCIALSTIDLSNLNLPNLTNADYIIQSWNQTIELRTVNLSNSIFGSEGKSLSIRSWIGSGSSYAPNFTSIDLRTTRFLGNIDATEMFCRCTALTDIKIASTTFNKLVNMSKMFGVCSYLETIDLSMIDGSQLLSISYLFDNCSLLTQAKLPDMSSNVNLIDYSYAFSNTSISDFGNVNFVYNPNVENISFAHLFRGMFKLKSVDFTGWDTHNVVSLYGAFYGCRELTSINFGNADFSKVINLNGLLGSCYKLTSFDATVFNSCKLIDLSNTFYDLSSVDNNQLIIDVSGWDTSRVTTLSATFSRSNCILRGLENWNVSNVATMSNMFYLYRNYNATGTSPVYDLSRWNTVNNTSLSNTFYGNLTATGLKNWNTSKVTSLYRMFCGNSRIQADNPDLSTWDVSNVTDMTGAFEGGGAVSANSIPELNLSGWNTSKVTSLDTTFRSCTVFNKLNLTGWKFNSVGTMQYTFQDSRFIEITGFSFPPNVKNYPITFRMGYLVDFIASGTIRHDLATFPNFDSNKNLSVDSLVSLLNCLQDATSVKTKNLVIGAANIAKLNEDQLAIATNKNWTLS